MDDRRPDIYHVVLDRLVRICDGYGHGGTIGARAARSGLWHRNATPEKIAELKANRDRMPGDLEQWTAWYENESAPAEDDGIRS